MRKRMEEANSKAMRDLFGITKENRILSKILNRNSKKAYKTSDDYYNPDWENSIGKVKLTVSLTLLSWNSYFL
jgi:hypothetical protein